MCMDEPQSWNHFASDELNRLLLEQSAAVIASLKKKWRGRLTTIIPSYSVQSVSSFRRHLHCIVGMSVDFPDLKTKKQAISY